MPLARLFRELEGDAVGRIAIRAVAPPLLVLILVLVFLCAVLALLSGSFIQTVKSERSSRGERRTQEPAQCPSPIRRGKQGTGERFETLDIHDESSLMRDEG
jgi:hypothetical protein